MLPTTKIHRLVQLNGSADSNFSGHIGERSQSVTFGGSPDIRRKVYDSCKNKWANPKYVLLNGDRVYLFIHGKYKGRSKLGQKEIIDVITGKVVSQHPVYEDLNKLVDTLNHDDIRYMMEVRAFTHQSSSRFIWLLPTEAHER